jgi:hypothetical protein
MYNLDSTCTQMQHDHQIVPFRYHQYGMSEIGPEVDAVSLQSSTVDWVFTGAVDLLNRPLLAELQPFSSESVECSRFEAMCDRFIALIAWRTNKSSPASRYGSHLARMS